MRLFAFLVRSLTFESALRLGSALGRFLFTVIGYRRQVALEQFGSTLGRGLSRAETRRTVARAYGNIGRTVVEVLKFPDLSNAEVLRRVSSDDLSGLDRLLARGKGVILLTGHFGNWELLGGYMALRGYPVNFVVADIRNRRVDDLLTACRTRWGVRIVRSGQAIRPILDCLRKNQCVAIVPDQDAGGDGLFVDFLGKTASINLGPAAISLRTGAPIYTGFLIRETAGRYHLSLPEPIDPDNYTGPRQEASEKLARACSDLIARYVQRYPDHWLWTHRRWKTRPPASMPSEEGARTEPEGTDG
ncbi:lysophospholipid acyltransferase family protein [candidate division KSB1 bacterium]